MSIDDLIEGLESRASLIKWGYNFHNKVNTKLKIDELKFEKFMKDMEMLVSGNNSKIYTYIYIYILISLIFLAVIYLFFKHYT
jgi:hypothetical protein